VRIFSKPGFVDVIQRAGLTVQEVPIT
jgi:hypothetical protein